MNTIEFLPEGLPERPSEKPQGNIETNADAKVQGEKLVQFKDAFESDRLAKLLDKAEEEARPIRITARDQRLVLLMEMAGGKAA